MHITRINALIQALRAECLNDRLNNHRREAINELALTWIEKGVSEELTTPGYVEISIRNRVIDMIRKDKRALRLVDHTPQFGAPVGGTRLDLITVRTLAGQDADILMMDALGYTSREIANAKDLTAPAVRQRLSRARKRLTRAVTAEAA